MALPAGEATWHDLPRSVIADIAAVAGRPVLNALDHQSETRRGEDFVSDALRATGSRVLLVYEALLVAQRAPGVLAWRGVDEVVALGAEHGDLRFLGVGPDGGARFSYEIDVPAPPGEATSLRDALGLLDELDAAAGLEAVALANWHRRHRYCTACGGATTVVEAGHARACASCDLRHFPRTDPAVIMLVADGERCVLGRRAGAPEGRWSTLAGFVEVGESAEQTVAREVFEEVGLRVDAVSYRGSQSWPFPGALMLAYRAHAPYGPLTVDHEHLEVAWFGREELRDAIGSGAVTIPPPIAAGHQLIAGFLEDGAS